MTYESSYGTARLVGKVISFFGWIVLAGAIIAGITIFLQRVTITYRWILLSHDVAYFSASERSDPTILAAVIGTAVAGF
jgi:hypothetical protein